MLGVPRESLTRALGFISPEKAALERCLDIARVLAAWHAQSLPSSGQPQIPSPSPSTSVSGSTDSKTGEALSTSKGSTPTESQAWVALGRALGLAYPGYAGAVSFEDLHQRLGLRLGPDRLAPGRPAQSQAGASSGVSGAPGVLKENAGNGIGPGRGPGGAGAAASAGSAAGAGTGNGTVEVGVGESAAPGAPRNLRWLWENCRSVSAGGQSHFSSDELSLSVLRLLRSSQHGDEVSICCRQEYCTYRALHKSTVYEWVKSHACECIVAA